MHSKQGFSPIANVDAKILILGSMPSSVSLQQQHYYAHSGNAFWKIISQLLKFSQKLAYNDKLIALKSHRLCLWDVIQSCERQGSLDSQINKKSIICNDFENFFRQYLQITHIFFNGRCAEQEYNRRVLPILSTKFQQIVCTRLPSTSPAMATLSFEKKLAAWQVIKPSLYH